MSEDRTQMVSDYVEAVFRRGREPMEPVGFNPDWADQPSRHKTYLGVRRFPLPASTPTCRWPPPRRCSSTNRPAPAGRCGPSTRW